MSPRYASIDPPFAQGGSIGFGNHTCSTTVAKCYSNYNSKYAYDTWDNSLGPVQWLPWGPSPNDEIWGLIIEVVKNGAPLDPNYPDSLGYLCDANGNRGYPDDYTDWSVKVEIWVGNHNDGWNQLGWVKYQHLTQPSVTSGWLPPWSVSFAYQKNQPTWLWRCTSGLEYWQGLHAHFEARPYPAAPSSADVYSQFAETNSGWKQYYFYQ